MLIPKTDSLDLQLSRLEHDAQDDLHLLQAGGVAYFSTEELCDLLLQCRLRGQQRQRLFLGSLCTCAAAPTAYFASHSAYKDFLATALLCLGIGALLYSIVRYQKASLNKIRQVIQLELAQRQALSNARYARR